MICSCSVGRLERKCLDFREMMFLCPRRICEDRVGGQMACRSSVFCLRLIAENTSEL